MFSSLPAIRLVEDGLYVERDVRIGRAQEESDDRQMLVAGYPYNAT
jgi:hypothetical protein